MILSKLTKLKKLLNFNAFTSFTIITVTLIYYGSKYYQQGEIKFLANQFGFYIGFVLLVILGFSCSIFLNLDQKRLIISLQDQLKLSNEMTIRLFKLLNVKLDNQADNNTELHLNTRDIILTHVEESRDKMVV